MRFHDLHHCCATYLAATGARLLEIADVLGHKTRVMVSRYAHLTSSPRASVIERMTQAQGRGMALRESGAGRRVPTRFPPDRDRRVHFRVERVMVTTSLGLSREENVLAEPDASVVAAWLLRRILAAGDRISALRNILEEVA